VQKALALFAVGAAGALLARPSLLLATPLWLAYCLAGWVLFVALKRRIGCFQALFSSVALFTLLLASHWLTAIVLLIGICVGTASRRP
jgi:hypothetical protein